MKDGTENRGRFMPLAEIEIQAVRPVSSGFVLEGSAPDGAAYQMNMHLEMPLDQRTRTVLGEMLVQSAWSILRKAPSGLRRRKPQRTGKRAIG
ncbi:MAG: hypothetical protein ACE5HT_12895 [Gemmatimonadales bacterium]